MNRKQIMIAGSLGACLPAIAALAQAQQAPVPDVLEAGKLYLRTGTVDTQQLPNLRAQRRSNPPRPMSCSLTDP